MADQYPELKDDDRVIARDAMNPDRLAYQGAHIGLFEFELEHEGVTLDQIRIDATCLDAARQLATRITNEYKFDNIEIIELT